MGNFFVVAGLCCLCAFVLLAVMETGENKMFFFFNSDTLEREHKVINRNHPTIAL